jgi:hypothetical protein
MENIILNKSKKSTKYPSHFSIFFPKFLIVIVFKICKYYNYSIKYTANSYKESANLIKI